MIIYYKYAAYTRKDLENRTFKSPNLSYFFNRKQIYEFEKDVCSPTRWEKFSSNFKAASNFSHYVNRFTMPRTDDNMMYR